MSVDKSAFNDLPLEERLEITQLNLQEVMKTLRLKESDFEDLQQEMKFHAIKNEELMDVVNAFRSSSVDRSRDIMRAKAEQNSELTLQNHGLRDLLIKSGEEVAALQKQLKEKAVQGESASLDNRSNERLQVQLNDLVKTLEKVEVSSIDIPSEWLNFKWKGIGGKQEEKSENDEQSKAIETIRNKITALDADRQRLLKQSKLYSKSDGDKEQRIAALERQVRQMKHERDEMKETNSALQQQMTVREGKIGALEELFQNINSNRSLDAEARAKKKVNKTKNGTVLPERSLFESEEEDYEDVDIDSTAGDNKSVAQSFEEMFVSIWTSFTCGKVPTKANNEDGVGDESSISSNSNADRRISYCFSSESYHTKQVEEELEAAARQEFEELQESHKTLNEDYESAQFKISDLTARLEEMIIKANSFEKKAGLREVMLKDVIQQYKELQMEHSASLDKMGQLKQKVKVLVQIEKEREQARRAEAAAMGNDTTKGTNYPKAIFMVGETPTFDMSERTERTSTDEVEGEDTPASSPHDLDNKFVMEDYMRLQNDCDRLQHEFDTAIEKISELEVSLKAANSEVRETKIVQANKARKIALMEAEKIVLQARIMEATTKIVDAQSTHTQRTVEVEDELRLAELREQKAREKQSQREQDLWEVIEQYKELAGQNESTKAEKAEIEQELALTEKVKIQRRDLVYEYRKLEKTLEEAVETGEQLAIDLQQAKNEVAKRKEETKGIRKRLAGCHFHYKQLQDQYDLVIKEKEDLDSRLSEFLKDGKLESLSKENEQLHTYCNELIVLATSTEADQ